MRPADLERDLGLEAELTDLFAVDPSPHFVSRVRAHVADDARKSSVWSARLVLGVVPAAAVAAVIAAAVWTAPTVEEPRTNVLAARPVANGIGPLPVAMSVWFGSAAVPSQPASNALSIAPRRLEVMIDPAEAAALQRLVAGRAIPSPEPRPAVVLVNAIEPLTAIDPIDIQAVADLQPVVIESLPTADEGVFQ